MMPVRRLMAKLVALGGAGTGDQNQQAPHGHGRVLKGLQSHGAGMLIQQRPDPTPGEVDALLMSDPVSTQDIESALLTTRPSSDGKAAR